MLLPLREGLLPSLILHWDLRLPIIGVEIMLLEIECPPSFGLFSLWVDDKISYCWLWGRVCWAAKYPPSFCFGINSCCVIVLTTVEVQIRLLEIECQSSCSIFSFLVDNKESYCWVPFSADYRIRENRSLRLSRGEEVGLPFPLPTNGYTCFPHRNVSERVFPHHQLAVGIWDKCLILFPVKFDSCAGLNNFPTLLVT